VRGVYLRVDDGEGGDPLVHELVQRLDDRRVFKCNLDTHHPHDTVHNYNFISKEDRYRQINRLHFTLEILQKYEIFRKTGQRDMATITILYCRWIQTRPFAFGWTARRGWFVKRKLMFWLNIALKICHNFVKKRESIQNCLKMVNTCVVHGQEIGGFSRKICY
jgi:hypothetical protein